jgi:hypothetical protein
MTLIIDFKRIIDFHALFLGVGSSPVQTLLTVQRIAEFFLQGTGGVEILGSHLRLESLVRVFDLNLDFYFGFLVRVLVD